MQNMNSISYVERELLLELEYILSKHRYECSSFENINTSNYTYMYRIKKALLKCTVEEKRVVVLQSIIKSVKNKIERGMGFKEIFEPLPTIISDSLKNYNKSKTVEEKDNKNTESNNKQNKVQAKTEFLVNIIKQIIPQLEGATKKELQALESEYNDYIMINTSDYGINNANVEILGALNTGIFESTKKNLEKSLYDDYRIKLKSTDKLSDKMSKDLLIYKVSALIYANVMCSKRITKIRPNINSNNINYQEYKGLKEDVRFLGKVVREKYMDDYGITPKDELIENYIGGQYSFEGLMKKRDAIVRRRDLK